jgi:hypothetical protein
MWLLDIFIFSKTFIARTNFLNHQNINKPYVDSLSRGLPGIALANLRPFYLQKNSQFQQTNITYMPLKLGFVSWTAYIC